MLDLSKKGKDGGEGVTHTHTHTGWRGWGWGWKRMTASQRDAGQLHRGDLLHNH